MFEGGGCGCVGVHCEESIDVVFIKGKVRVIERLGNVLAVYVADDT